MITMKISGGLGNQLFQYATGRGIEARKQQVQYDISPLDSDPQRCYLLDRLGLRLPTVRHNYRGGIVYSDPDLRFRPDILAVQGDCILSGFWQCEKYFLAVQDQIRAEVFRGMPLISDASQAVAEKIRACQSVFLHIRRTDNTHPAHAAVHGLLDRSEYYRQAISQMHASLRNPHFFVFSDDPKWAHEHYDGPGYTVVDCNPTSGTPKGDGELVKGFIGRENEDLWLMSLCQHGIVANSTFSWWGAWLNPMEKQTASPRVIIAPKQQGWFNATQTRLDSSDIIPSRWMRL